MKLECIVLTVNVHFAPHKASSHFLLVTLSVSEGILEALLQFSFMGLLKLGPVTHIQSKLIKWPSCCLCMELSMWVSTFGAFQTRRLSAVTLQQDGMKKSHDQMLNQIEKLLKEKSHLCEHLVCWSLELVFSAFISRANRVLRFSWLLSARLLQGYHQILWLLSWCFHLDDDWNVK